nr:DUF3077 domain-containing protein [Azonexus sp.]
CPKGYGRLRIEGKQQRAHRLMHQLRHGPIADGLVVRHSCDNPFEVALEQASCFAATVADLVSQAALDEDTYQLWAASYLAEMSKAILESACKAMYREKRHE